MESTTRLIDLTVGELMTLIAREVKETQQKLIETLPSRLNGESDKSIYYGLEGMAEVLNCSISKVAKYKSMGYLEGGYQQIGKTIIVKDAQALRDVAERAFQKSRKKLARTNKSIIH